MATPQQMVMEGRRVGRGSATKEMAAGMGLPPVLGYAQRSVESLRLAEVAGSHFTSRAQEDWSSDTEVCCWWLDVRGGEIRDNSAASSGS